MKNKQPFAVFDIDGTLIRWQLYHSLVDELGKLSAINPDDMETIKRSRMIWKERRHADTFNEYQQTLVQIFHKNLPLIHAERFDKAATAVFERYKDQVYTFTRDLIAELKEKNYLLFVVSGSQHEIISKLANYYGFDDAIGNTYERVDGKFTGQHEHVVENKPEALKKLIAKHEASMSGSLAIGDSASDAPLLEMVEKPIAFNPDKALYEHARSKDWPIVKKKKKAVYKNKKTKEGTDGRA